MSFFSGLFVVCWDLWLSFVNLVTPKLKVGHVVPEGHPGAGGEWPEYIAPSEGDSRCSCPCLNAMSNHGILPRNGRGISFRELNQAVRATFNFAPSFCYFVPNYAAQMLKRRYATDTFDLKDLDLHNGIEHDASLTREDVFHQKDQAKPHLPFVRELIASASGTADGKRLLTASDLSKYSSKRRFEARKHNPEFSLSTFHKMFGSSNSSTLLTIFGGNVEVVESILVEERIPDGWEPSVRARKGLTIAKFNATVLKVEFGINEKKYGEQERQEA